MLAQAMRSTMATAPSSTSSGVRTSPTSCRRSGSAKTMFFGASVDSGSLRGFPSRSRQKSSLRRAISRAASCGLRPGASLPIVGKHQQPSDCGSVPRGIHSSARFGKSNPGRMIPTTVNGLPSRVRALPTIRGSPPKRRCHKPWLTTVTWFRSRASSSGRKVRPSCGVAPRSRKKSAVTVPVFSRSGSPAPVRVTL